MKKLLTGIMLLLPTLLWAQNADSRIDTLIRKLDWFGLEQEYHRSKEALSPHYRLLAEGMIGVRFNIGQQAHDAFAELLQKHQDKLPQHMGDLLFLFHQTLFEIGGDYNYAADSWKNILDQIDADLPPEIRRQFWNYYRQIASYRDIPPQQWRQRRQTCTTPFSYKKVGRGEIMVVPAQINGQTAEMIFDTGCSTNLISEAYARELGIRILADSIPIKGVNATYYGKTGVADSVVVGGIFCSNARFAIIPDSETTLDSVQLKAFLGLPFVRPLPEIQIYPQKQQIVFLTQGGTVPDNAQRNLAITDILLMQASFKGQPLTLLFDTGNAAGDLSGRFYGRFREWTDRNSRPDSIPVGGMGGIQHHAIRELSAIDLQFGDQNLTFKNLPVLHNETADETDGNIGVSLVRLCDKITINLKKMVLQIEPLKTE